MIDLANRLEPNFSSSKKSGIFCLKLLYIGEGRGAWKKYEIVLVLMVL
jgi:hypothetical protein